MGTNECSQRVSKSSWDSQDFSMVFKVVHFRKSTRPQWVNRQMSNYKMTAKIEESGRKIGLSQLKLLVWPISSTM